MTITPEELDAAWGQRHTLDVPTLAGIATLHLDMCDLDSIDEDPANFLFLQRASWCIHKLELVKLMTKPTTKAFVDGLRQTWDPRPLERDRVARPVQGMGNVPTRACGSSLPNHPPHTWTLVYAVHENRDDEMFWCGGG